MDDIQSIIKWVLGIIGWTGAIWLAFDRVLREKRKAIDDAHKETDELDEKLIVRLKEMDRVREEENKGLKKQIADLSIEVQKLRAEVLEVKSDRDRLVEIFQGRDEGTKKFQEEFLKFIPIVKQIDSKVDILLTNKAVHTNVTVHPTEPKK